MQLTRQAYRYIPWLWYSILPSFIEVYQVVPSFTGFYWVLPGFTEFYRVLPSFTEFYRVLPSFTGFYRVLPSNFLSAKRMRMPRKRGRRTNTTGEKSGSPSKKIPRGIKEMNKNWLSSSFFFSFSKRKKKTSRKRKRTRDDPSDRNGPLPSLGLPSLPSFFWVRAPPLPWRPKRPNKNQRSEYKQKTSRNDSAAFDFARKTA